VQVCRARAKSGDDGLCIEYGSGGGGVGELEPSPQVSVCATCSEACIFGRCISPCDVEWAGGYPGSHSRSPLSDASDG